MLPQVVNLSRTSDTRYAGIFVYLLPNASDIMRIQAVGEISDDRDITISVTFFNAQNVEYIFQYFIQSMMFRYFINKWRFDSETAIIENSFLGHR